MIQPHEMKLSLPMRIANDALTTTTKVWEILTASYYGDLERIKTLVSEEPNLAFAQYNYTPPINFAVREGHIKIVEYLLNEGAHAPNYKFYPFQESLQTVANDRGFYEIEELLNQYGGDLTKQKYSGDNGEIYYERSTLAQDFENAVDRNDLGITKQILQQHPEFALDETYFWGEGILMMPTKENQREMMDLLIEFGAKVPKILKWTQFYYFERLDGATYIMQNGMDPNTMSWQHVTILHDMAQKNQPEKAKLLLDFGANINVIDEAYQSTPLGLAVRWGHLEMAKFLMQQGADVNLAGTHWSTPLAWARKKGHQKIEEWLINLGAK